MKKALSLLLAVLMIFTVSSATLASAADVTIIFYDHNNALIEKIEVEKGTAIVPPAYPDRAAVVHEDGSKTEYTFAGWAKYDGTNIDTSKYYYSQDLKVAEESAQYIAVYSEKTTDAPMTFWNLIEMIFSKFNAIFEYFYIIFG